MVVPKHKASCEPIAGTETPAENVTLTQISKA